MGQSETWTPSGLSQQVVTEIVRERQEALRRVAELEARLAEALDALKSTDSWLWNKVVNGVYGPVGDES